MKHLAILVLFLFIGKGTLAQETTPITELLLEDSVTQKKVKIMVGDVVSLHFKKPDITVKTTILSISESAVVISVTKMPYKQTVALQNIYSMTLLTKGNLWGVARFSNSPDTVVYQIRLKDDNEYIGTIVSQNLEKIVFRTTSLGEINISKHEIERIEIVNAQQVRDGVLWFDNPQASRYFWQPNGYGVKKGEAYYQNVWILFNQFTLGVSDNFSIGAGMVPLFLFGGAATPIWANAKFSVPVKPGQLNLGGGVLAGTVIGDNGDNATSSGFGVAYGISTFGSRDKNFSIGFGYGYAGGEWASKPTISLSAMVRTGPRGYLLTENYYLGSADGGLVLISLGARRIVKRTGIDFGLFMPFSKGIGTVVGIPWLGITTPLGK